MREYKFRAWDVQKSEMSKPFELGGYPLFQNDRTASYWPKMTLLMQFTGFKDKKGKDIYEGDIVFDPSKEYGGNKTVAWNEREAKFELNYKLGHSLLQSEEFLEVIGNKYEHSELLKK